MGATLGYPHVVFLSADGDKLAECLGYKPADEFKSIVERSLAMAQGR